MELRQLRYFVVICEEGSLSRAGARLHIAQQSLSQTVVTLETELGVSLLQRGAFGVRTTVAGRVLRDRSAALLRDADAAARAVQQAAGLGVGHVRIRYGLDSEHIVNRLLPRIQARVPDVEIAGWTGPDSDNLPAIRAGDADLGIVWAVKGHVGDLHTATIAYEQCWVAVPARHELAGCDRLPVEALAGQSLVMFPRDAAPWVFDHIAGHLTVDGRPPPRITLTAVSGQSGMVDVACATGAVTPVSQSQIETLQRPGVAFVPLDPALTVPLDLVWRTGLSPAAAAVVDAALTELI